MFYVSSLFIMYLHHHTHLQATLSIIFCINLTQTLSIISFKNILHTLIQKHFTHTHSKTFYTHSFKNILHTLIQKQFTHTHSKTFYTHSFKNILHTLIQKHFTHTHSKTFYTHSFKNMFPPPYSYPKLFVLPYPIYFVEIYPKYFTVSYVLCGRRGSAYFRAVLVQISAPFLAQISAPFWCRFLRHFGADFRAILAHISKPTSKIFFSHKTSPKKIFAPPESFLQIHTYPPYSFYILP